MEKLFKLKQNGTTVRTEIIAGLTTFFTMAYIIFVNQTFLGEGTPANMPNVAVMTATCLAACIGTWLIGFLTNYPLAQAPGMGLNAFFCYTMCLGMGLSWKASLAAVFLAGIFFILLTVTGARKAIVDAIPYFLKKAISAGIGLFIALIGFNNAGLLDSTKGTIIAMGNLNVPTTLLALFGLILTIVLVVCKVPGALFISIIGTSAVGCFVQFVFNVPMGITLPQSWVPAFDFSTFGACFTGFGELFSTPVLALITALISLVLVDMFDTIGTLVGAADKARLSRRKRQSAESGESHARGCDRDLSWCCSGNFYRNHLCGIHRRHLCGRPYRPHLADHRPLLPARAVPFPCAGFCSLRSNRADPDCGWRDDVRFAQGYRLA